MRIERETLRALKSQYLALAVHRSVEELCEELRAIDFEPYAPVRDQLRILLRALNRKRHAASLEPVPREALRWHRVPVRPFAEPGVGAQ